VTTDEEARQHCRRLGVTLIVAAVLAAGLYILLLWPVNDTYAGSPRMSWTAFTFMAGHVGAGLALSAVGLALLVNFVGHNRPLKRHTARYVATALALPIAFLVWWAADLRLAHPVQREAVRAFNAYTNHFPVTQLDGPFIHARVGHRAEVCSARSGHDPRIFCAVVDTGCPGGRQIITSFTTTDLTHLTSRAPASPAYCR
jgi:hypothetical protein